MLLDVRFLIELVRSYLPAWTTEACERIVAALNLKETGSSPGRRDFSASTGLCCSLYASGDSGPIRLEFPFPLPNVDQGDAHVGRQLVELTAWPLKAVLGEPAFRGEPATPGFPRTSSALFRTHWTLPMATVAVELQASGAPEPDMVALIVERPAPPEQQALAPEGRAAEQ